MAVRWQRRGGEVKMPAGTLRLYRKETVPQIVPQFAYSTKPNATPETIYHLQISHKIKLLGALFLTYI
jgi:hypothetical protein